MIFGCRRKWCNCNLDKNIFWPWTPPKFTLSVYIYYFPPAQKTKNKQASFTSTQVAHPSISLSSCLFIFDHQWQTREKIADCDNSFSSESEWNVLIIYQLQNDYIREAAKKSMFFQWCFRTQIRDDFENTENMRKPPAIEHEIRN